VGLTLPGGLEPGSA